MTRLSVLLVLSIGVVACSNLPQKDWHGSTGLDTADSDTDTDADTDTDTDSDTDTDTDTDTDSDTDTDTAPDAGFEEPGDIVTYVTDSDGFATVELADAGGESNRDQEFYLVVVNTGNDDDGYRLRYEDGSSSPGPTPPPMASGHLKLAQPRRAIHHEFAPPPPADVLTSADIGDAQQEFLVRKDLNDTSAIATVNARLWALGDNVAIWVDEGVQVDWDIECDGVIDVPADNEAYGFNNCDLSDVADIMDTNIVPNLEALYGDVSDINGDGRVSVLITAELNAITTTSADDTNWTSVLPSYASPDVDLEPFDRDANPGSNNQEVIYVYAPDPYGFYNTNTGPEGPSVESYTGYQLAGEFARSFTKLISYNQHVVLPSAADDTVDYIPEEEWVLNVLGTLGGDYCGFGAAYYDDVWLYLDAPHLAPLAAASTDGSLETLTYGAQYLFGRWLYDRAELGGAGAGATLLAAIAQSSDTTGRDSVEEGTGEDLADLALAWQIGMLTTGITDSTGGPLVDPAEYAPIAAASTISAPPSSPGSFFGANGYQSGVNLYGENHLYQGGTTDSPTEIPEDVVTTSDQFAFLYAPGFEFQGFATASFGVSVVRLTGITYDQAVMSLQASGDTMVGAVIRWNDPEDVNYAVENIASNMDVNPIDLPALPSDGSIITGEGSIDPAVPIGTLDPSGATGSADVADTDRWLLDLTDRPATDVVPVAVWLKRHFEDTTGGVGPSDPWVAIVPQDLVPEPTPTGTRTNSTCTGAPVFGFPGTLLTYLYAQQMLSSTMYSDGDFSPCGTPPEDSGSAPTCDLDWDLDGISDENEALPSSLLEQIEVADCTAQGATTDTYESSYSLSWMDADEQDEDDRPSRDYANNTGGRVASQQEEGYVQANLPGGTTYLLIVGGNGDTGTYEINVRQTQH